MSMSMLTFANILFKKNEAQKLRNYADYVHIKHHSFLEFQFPEI